MKKHRTGYIPQVTKIFYAFILILHRNANAPLPNMEAVYILNLY